MHKNLFLCGIFILFMMSAVIGKAQLLKMNGWVVDERGKPLAGASVWVKNTTFGTTTDKDGGFVLQQRVEGETLVGKQRTGDCFGAGCLWEFEQICLDRISIVA